MFEPNDDGYPHWSPRPLSSHLPSEPHFTTTLKPTSPPTFEPTFKLPSESTLAPTSEPNLMPRFQPTSTFASTQPLPWEPTHPTSMQSLEPTFAPTGEPTWAPESSQLRHPLRRTLLCTGAYFWAEATIHGTPVITPVAACIAARAGFSPSLAPPVPVKLFEPISGMSSPSGACARQ